MHAAADLLPAWLAFLLAALCAGVMGYAIQRGGTCTVAAVDELVSKRRWQRLAAMAEASLWVAGGLLLARTLHLLPEMPAAYAVSGFTLLGGAMLGFGAWVNGACVFGAVARLGSGEWAYLATPPGFYAGCLSVGPLFMPAAARRLAEVSPVLQAPLGAALMFVAFALWRIGGALRGGLRPGELGRRVWSPHAATAVIGVTFLFSLLLAGAWAYTDVLAELARGMAHSLPARGALLLALLLGALWGGWTAGRLRATPPSAAKLLRCFVGGLVMGWGSLLIPGANDGLILIGMPLLRPYAWLAFTAMCLAIAAALLLSRRLAMPVAGRSAG